MYTIPVNYTLKWQFKNAEHIQVATDKTIINTKTGRVIKETVCGGSYGYWIDRKFILTKKVTEHIEKIAIFDLPY